MIGSTLAFRREGASLLSEISEALTLETNDCATPHHEKRRLMVDFPQKPGYDH
jgi:hypothetical protein